MKAHIDAHQEIYMNQGGGVRSWAALKQFYEKVRRRGGDAARKDRAVRYQRAIAATNWYFTGEGKGFRIATFLCNVALVATAAATLITVCDVGAVLLHTIADLNSEHALVREAVSASLAHISALEYVTKAENVLRAHLVDQCISSVTLAVFLEGIWTVRRAGRLVPPPEFLAGARVLRP